MNTFMENLENEFNYVETENKGLAHKTTGSKVYDMFALGGAYRTRPDEDCILLFKNALEENESLALKCLFYLRDVRGGQGERRFFRVCYKWLANKHTDLARRNMKYLPTFGRWDDLIYTLIDTPLQEEMLEFIYQQWRLDLQCETPSLLGKWMPSINASAKETKRLGNIIREYLNITQREYRKSLSELREKIKVVERLMSANRWTEIQFDKIPSRAGIIYKNAFARRDIIAKQYEAFAKDENTTVNASTLYPYDVVAKALEGYNYWSVETPLSDTDRAMIEKYWNNLPDYIHDSNRKVLCVCDTSGSMIGNSADAPINVAIGLSMYCAERITGAFHNHYISFSSEPQLIDIEGIDFVDKVQRIYRTNLCENTDLVKTFELLRAMAKKSKSEDRPTDIIVISDMEIDYNSRFYNEDEMLTEMETERRRWLQDSMEMPHLTYWNVQSRNENKFLDMGSNVTCVSGCSPVILEQILSGATGYDVMLSKLNSNRYSVIQ